MTNIKAFVGHSFTDDDAQVVASFVKIFDQIKAVLPSFDWTHARQAEPEDLAKKVLRLAADCNTFIGICTKKEMVTQPEAIFPRFLTTKSSIVSNDQLAWKTSDWIVQEIGLAIGYSMSLVILLEDGCRRPGGLQGDIEFIPFNRDTPEKAFGQILEMLRAIDPPADARIETSPDGDTGTDPKKLQDTKSLSEAEEADLPTSDWTIIEYENALFWKIYKKDEEGTERIKKSFHASDLGSSAEKRAEWDAKCEEWRLRFGDKGSLDTLKTLHGKFPANLAIHTSYASALALYSHNEESAELYEAASKFESSPTEVLGNVIEAALERAKAGQLDKALKLFDEAKSLSKNASDFSYQLAHGINRYAEITKDEELRIEAMERIIWLRPDDDDVRFSLAYAHSEAKNNDMALFHYLAIPSSRRGAHTWNNLGVSYQNFSVPTRSIVAFEKAAAEGNTLAMSNLAYRYMNNGFTREARERLNNAFTKEDPHKNVNEAYATLSEINDNETKIVDEILATTKKKADTFKKLGQAICDPDIITLEPVWTSPDSELAVKIDGKKFEARGRYEVKNILSGLLGTAKPSEYELILTGNITGRRVFGEIRRKSLSSTASSILSEGDQQKRFAIVFASDFQSAEVIESIDTRSPRYYEIRVKSETVALPAA